MNSILNGYEFHHLQKPQCYSADIKSVMVHGSILCFIVILKYIKEKMYTKLKSLLKWEWLIFPMMYHTLSFCRCCAINTPTAYIWALCGCPEFSSTKLNASCSAFSVPSWTSSKFATIVRIFTPKDQKGSLLLSLHC